MKRRELEAHLLTLETTAPLLAKAGCGLSREQLRRPSERTGRSFTEDIAHLAEAERDLFGVWIAELRNGNGRALPDLAEPPLRREGEGALEEALERFRSARARNVETLLALTREDWKRWGRSVSGSLIRFEDVPRMMAEHDRRHTIEIAILLEELNELNRRPTARGATGGVRLVPCTGI